MLTKEELERIVANVCIFCIIIGKLDYPKEPAPIVLLIVDKGFKVGLDDTILSLGLAICL